MKTCRCGNSDLERARKKAYFLERPTKWNPDERVTKVTTIEGLPLFLIQIKKKIQVNFRKASPSVHYFLLAIKSRDRKDILSCSFGAGALVDLSHSDEGLLLRQR